MPIVVEDIPELGGMIVSMHSKQFFLVPCRGPALELFGRKAKAKGPSVSGYGRRCEVGCSLSGRGQCKKQARTAGTRCDEERTNYVPR